MTAVVFGADLALPVAIESGEWIHAAWYQFAAENVLVVFV